MLTGFNIVLKNLVFQIYGISHLCSVLKNIKERLVKSLELVNGKLLYFRTLCGTSRSEAFTNIKDFGKDLKC